MDNEKPFWQVKELSQLSPQEWESLCDGCGKCCLHKLQDEETDELVFTSISCQYLDTDNCHCRVYPKRKEYVPDCLNLNASSLAEMHTWLPNTCAYRLLYEGKSLPSWHPLVCGDTQIIHLQHISVRDKAISELLVGKDDWEDYII